MPRVSAAARHYGLEPAKKPGPGRPKKQLKSLSEVAEYLSVSRNLVYRLIEDGCPVVQIDAHLRRFDLEAVLRWLDARAAKKRAEGWW